MFFKLKDNIKNISSCIPNDYIWYYYSDITSDSIMLMDLKGKSCARMYWYHDDNTKICLDMLTVNSLNRNEGLGTKLQKIRENIGVTLGAKVSLLWVVKDTWMFDWYIRRGYVYHDEYEQEDAVWMIKELDYEIFKNQ